MLAAAPLKCAWRLASFLNGRVVVMRFLCLAYGDGKDWNALSKKEQDELLAQDEVIRKRGALMAAVEPKATVVRAWDGKATTSDGPFASSPVPLAGYSVIEAESAEEVVRLVAGTPCARARGAIEIRPLLGQGAR
jgi:hypothetical protein